MLVTLLGIVTRVRPLQPEKAPYPIVVSSVSITDFNAVGMQYVSDDELP